MECAGSKDTTGHRRSGSHVVRSFGGLLAASGGTPLHLVDVIPAFLLPRHNREQQTHIYLQSLQLRANNVNKEIMEHNIL